LTSALQLELGNVAVKYIKTMSEDELRKHIRNSATGLTPSAQLPTTSRLNEVLKEQQSLKNAEAQISELLEEEKKSSRKGTI
jgi:hypothetical protein